MRDCGCHYTNKQAIKHIIFFSFKALRLLWAGGGGGGVGNFLYMA